MGGDGVLTVECNGSWRRDKRERERDREN